MGYDPVELGERIVNLRKKKGLTQEQLAAQLNISPDYMQKIEKAHRNCSMDIIINAALFFNVSIDYMLLGENPFDQEERKRHLLTIAQELIDIAEAM